MPDAPVPRCQTGVPGLDDILHGGLIPHRLYLLEGTPGAGKTTISLKYLQEGVLRGEQCLYITLSESREELIAGAASHGWSLDGIEIVELVASEQELDGEQEVTMYHPAEVELTETVRLILEAVTRINPSRIVVDSLSELAAPRAKLAALSTPDSRAETIFRRPENHRPPPRRSHLRNHRPPTPEHRPRSDHARTTGPGLRRGAAADARGQIPGDELPGRVPRFFHRIGRRGRLPALIAAEHGVAFPRERIESGVTALDALLGGGPDRGTSTLLVGPAGTGKSTIAVQYAVAAASRGDHAAIFAFDESSATLEARTTALGIGWSRA